MQIPPHLIAEIFHSQIDFTNLIREKTLLFSEYIGCPVFSQQMILHITGCNQFNTLQLVQPIEIDIADLVQIHRLRGKIFMGAVIKPAPQCLQ